MIEPDLTQARRRAKELVRAARAGDRAALARLRPDRPPRLADAQHAVAGELGFRSWPALVERAGAAQTPAAPATLAAARATWGERAEIELDTDLSYLPGRPVRVRIRKRSHRYLLDDLGRAVAGAGAPPGWPAVAERVVAERGLNVDRRGRVFVPAVEGRDLDALLAKVAEASHAVHTALLELEE
jgi:hypothetical protein